MVSLQLFICIHTNWPTLNRKYAHDGYVRCLLTQGAKIGRYSFDTIKI